MKKTIRNVAWAFALFMAICVVFGRTIMNLNAASISMVYPTRNYLKHTYEAEGEIVWGDPMPVTLYDAQEYPVVFSQVNMVPGQHVEAGTVLAKGTPDDKWEEARNDLEAQVEILRHEMWQRKSQAILTGARLTTAKSLEALDMLRLEQALFAKEKEIVRKAHDKSVSIPDDPQAWGAGFLTPDHEVNALCKQWMTLKGQIAAQQDKLSAIYRSSRYNRDLSFLIDMETYEKKISALEFQTIQTMKVGQRLQTITSHMDGFVAQVNIHAHQRYAAAEPAYVLSSGPTLAVDITQSSRIVIREGTTCQVVYQGKVYPGEVRGINTTHEAGRQTKSAIISADCLADSDANPADIIGKKAKVIYSETTDMYDCVVPISAIAFTGSGPEVYMVERREGYWNIEFKLKAVPVEILDTNDSYAAIAGSVYGGNYLANKWDRPVGNGSKVIPIT